MVEVMPARLTDVETEQLRAAVPALEGGGCASRAAERLGRRREGAGRPLPCTARNRGARAGETAADGGYFAIRTLLARTVSEGARFVLQRGLAEESAPILVRLVAQVAARFGVVVSQKLAAQAIPVLGAVGGAAVNLAFTEHF